MTFQEALEVFNNAKETAWDKAAFPTMSDEQLEAARKGFHAGIYQAALAFSNRTA